MKKILCGLFIYILVITIVPVLAHARNRTAPQPYNRTLALNSRTDGGWDRLVTTVKIGKKVIVTLTDSTTIEGKLLAIDAHSISIAQAKGQQTIENVEVVRVHYAGQRKRHMLCGMCLGMAVGAVATMIVDNQSAHPSSHAEAAGIGALFIGLPVGAVAGALVPTGPPLYEVRIDSHLD